MKPSLSWDNFSYRGGKSMSTIAAGLLTRRHLVSVNKCCMDAAPAVWQLWSPAKTSKHSRICARFSGEDKQIRRSILSPLINRKRITLEDALLILDFALFKNIRVLLKRRQGLHACVGFEKSKPGISWQLCKGLMSILSGVVDQF